MRRVKTDIPILKHRRAVYVLSIGVVFATLSLVAGWLFTREVVYMNYAPQAKRSRMPLQSFGAEYAAELPGSFHPSADREGVFRTRWGEEVRFWIRPAEESDVLEPGGEGHFTPRAWQARLAPEGEVLTCRYVRHPLGFGAEVLWRTETAYIHALALVEGAERPGALPHGSRVLRLQMEVPRKRYGTFRPLLIQMISTLSHAQREHYAETENRP